MYKIRPQTYIPYDTTLPNPQNIPTPPFLPQNIVWSFILSNSNQSHTNHHLAHLHQKPFIQPKTALEIPLPLTSQQVNPSNFFPSFHTISPDLTAFQYHTLYPGSIPPPTHKL